MTKISNQIVYIPDTEISGLDYLVGTDIDNANKTVSFKVEDLSGHFNITNGVRNFDYNFYNHIAVSSTPNVGCFYSNDNEIDPNNITYFIFSKLTNRRKDVTEFINSISVTNPFDVIISQKQDVNQNSVFFFRITDVEVFSNYYKLNVSEVFFPENKVLYHILSYAVFNLKSDGETIHNNLQGLNDGDYKHLTIEEKTKFDSLPNSFAIKTSDLTNDGSDGTSTYVETNELGASAFSNDYNDLDNKPTIPTPISNHSELNLDDGTNPHGTTKSDVGLSNVDNTSDANKPISTATQNALDLKQDILTDINFGTFANSLTTENAIADGDEFNFTDISDTNKQKKSVWSNIRAVLKTYYDTIYQAVLVSGTNIKTINGNSILGSGDLAITSTNKQIFQWWGGNWTTTNLNQYYYISYNGRAIETTPGGTGTTVSASMQGRNHGLFIAPFNCKIKRVMFKEGGSGSYTGAFVVASGLPNYGGTWNIGYTNIVTHLNQAISATGSEQHKNEFLVTDNITVPKGYVVSPMLIFSAQAFASKLSIEISIEIEEVV